MLTPILISSLLERARNDFKRTQEIPSHAIARFTDILDYNSQHNVETGVDGGIATQVARYIRHITVNPNNSFATALILKSYVFAACEKGEAESVVNLSMESARRFVGSLIEMAQRERELSLTNDEVKRASVVSENNLYIVKSK